MGGKLRVNPWCSAEVRVETLILAVNGGKLMVKSPALQTLLVIPNTDIIGWEKLIVENCTL